MKSRSYTKTGGVWLLSGIAALLSARSLLGGDSLEYRPGPIERIPPGTIIQNKAPAGWTHLVLFAKPRVAAGDVDAVPAMVKRYAAMFSLGVLANVVPETVDGQVRYRLDKVAIGNCVVINGRYVVVNSDTYKQLGAKLDFIAQRILAGSEKNLGLAEQVARNNALSIFDAQAFMFWEGEHRPMVVRHMVWVSPETGKLGSLVWLLEKDGSNGYRLAERFLRALPNNFVEDRVFRVDASKVTLGFPAEDAIALNAMPPGSLIPVGARLAQLVSARRYSDATLVDLAQELNATIHQIKTAGKPD